MGPEKILSTIRRACRGPSDLDEVLKDRLNGLKANRDRAKAALDAAMSQRVADIRIDPAMIESFGRTMRQKLTRGSVPFGRPTFALWSTSARSMTRIFGSKAARMCSNELS